jgi:hypothetical protein
MKTITASLYAACIFTWLPARPVGAATPDTNPPPRLTVELRDGSRVVGTSGEKNFKFHSALLGDFKLDVIDLRSIDCVSSNAVKLTAANGDVLAVQFAAAELRVQTGFGKVELPVNSIRKFTVSATGCSAAHRPGLVALWSGEDNATDAVGAIELERTDIAFAEGKVGRAFSLNGFSSCMEVPENPSLDVGCTGAGLTISAWIKPENVSGLHPILEWNPSDKIPGVIGVQLWIGNAPGSQGVLAGHVVGDGQPHSLISPPGMVVPGRFQHVAVTYNKASGAGVLYLNGTVVARSQWGSFEPLTKGNLWISRRPTDHPGDWTYNAFFTGLLDEIALYNRALSAEEIKSICIEDNHGEPLPSPNPARSRFSPGFNGNGFAPSSE